MECHLFCHNELPMALTMVPFLAFVVGTARAKLRRWTHRS